jgi:ATP-dependent DNA helicase PIF1
MKRPTKDRTSPECYPYYDARNPSLLTDIIRSLLEGRRLFLSGGAGTGKTTLVRKIAKEVSRQGQEIVLTASTGLAACQLRDETGLHNSYYVKGPTTLHSAAYLPITQMPDSSRRISSGTRKLEKAAVIVIDEISMVDRVTFDRFLQRVCPGTGLLAVGDFFQLPPVLKDDSGQPDFAFHSPQFATFELIELKTVLRQAEPRFVQFLQHLRDGQVDSSMLNGVEGDFDPDYPVLFGTNLQADRHNRQCLHAIDEPSVFSICQVKTGDPEEAINWLESYTRTKARFEMRRFMRVLCIQNHEELVNGDLGTVIGISSEYLPETELPCWVDVQFDRKEVGTRRLFPFEFQERQWNAKSKKEDVRFAVLQYPVVPAYGLTVHKAQGMTLAVVNIDGSRINFVPGHVYVALSRVQTLAGLRLRSPDGFHAFTDPTVLEYYRNARRFTEPQGAD